MDTVDWSFYKSDWRGGGTKKRFVRKLLIPPGRPVLSRRQNLFESHSPISLCSWFRSISTYRPYINHSFSSRPKMAPTLNIEGKRILLEQGLKQGFPSFKKILVIIIIHSFIQFVLACATIFHQHSSFKFDVPFRNENRPGRHLCLVRKSLRERTDRKDSYETWNGPTAIPSAESVRLCF